MLERSDMAAPPVERTRPAPTAERRKGRDRDEEVLVWPDLVFVEFICAVLFTITLTVLSAAISAPLLDKANPDSTPNPSKAPWYFLNLQELLLHMHPALAGVLVPTAALIAIGALPYIDRDTSDVGKWVPQPNAIPIIVFSAIYTSILIPIMLLLDEEQTCGVCGLKRFLGLIADGTGLHFLTNVWISGVLLPTFIMLAPIFILVWILRRK